MRESRALSFSKQSSGFDSLWGFLNDTFIWSHNQAGSPATAIYVGITWGITTIGSITPVIQVSFRGIPLSRVFLETAAPNPLRRELWRRPLLSSDLPGAGNIVVSAQPTFDGDLAACGGAVTVDGTGPPYVRQGTSASGNSTTPSVIVPGCLLSSGVLDVLGVNHNAVFVTRTAGAFQTLRANTQVLATGDLPLMMSNSMSTEIGLGGAHTMSWTLSAARAWATRAVEIANT